MNNPILEKDKNSEQIPQQRRFIEGNKHMKKCPTS